MGSFRSTPLARRARKRRPALTPGAAKGPLRAVTRSQPPGLAKGALRVARRVSPPVVAARKGPLAAVRRPSWKLVGLAGLAGVAATGVVVARNRRAHRELPPDELRERLHQRLAEAGSAPVSDGGGEAEP